MCIINSHSHDTITSSKVVFYLNLFHNFYVLFFYYFDSFHSHGLIPCFLSTTHEKLLHVNKNPSHHPHKPISRSSTNPPSWHEEEDASIASSSYSKKQQPFPQQKPLQTAPQQQTQSQSQHSPGSNELKLTAQQSSDDKSLFENDAGNMENETKSVSSMRSQDR
jgi:hypothetical protein